MQRIEWGSFWIIIYQSLQASCDALNPIGSKYWLAWCALGEIRCGISRELKTVVSKPFHCITEYKRKEAFNYFSYKARIGVSPCKNCFFSFVFDVAGSAVCTTHHLLSIPQSLKISDNWLTPPVYSPRPGWSPSTLQDYLLLLHLDSLLYTPSEPWNPVLSYGLPVTIKAHRRRERNCVPRSNAEGLWGIRTCWLRWHTGRQEEGESQVTGPSKACTAAPEAWRGRRYEVLPQYPVQCCSRLEQSLHCLQ